MQFFKVLFLVSGLAFLGGCVSTGGTSGATAVATTDAAPLSDVAGAISAELFAGPPQWQLGSFWEYSDGYGLRVSETDGKTATLERTDQRGSWVKRDGLFKVDSMDAGVRRQEIYHSSSPTTLFPLAVGKSVSFVREYMAGKELHVHQTSWSVEGREKIEIPAGTFDCWILVWSTRSQKSGWSGYEKWWYSPEVGNYVRLEYRYGKTPSSSRVLMKYKKGV